MLSTELFPFLTGIAAGVGFLFATFATKKYVDTKHEGVLDVLQDIRKRIMRIENQFIKGDD